MAHGMTADEWGRLPASVRRFHERAFSELQQRQNAQMPDESSLRSRF